MHAFVEELAGIGGHDFLGAESALRASQHRLEHH
jgi:hypothetical protein